MAKHLTKLWARSWQRLLERHSVTPVARRSGARSARPPLSRVGPRAAAWAAGTWLRALHTPAAPGARSLDYGLYLPADRPTAGMPLIVMLHGCSQSIDEFAQGTRMNLLADRHGFAVLYPEQSERAHGHRCWHWYDLREPAGGGELAAVCSLVDALVAEYRFDAARVSVAGLSAGAGLAAALAVQSPQRFAAVALHSGPVFGEAHSGISAMDVMRRGARHDPAALVERASASAGRRHPGIPALIVHGDDDHVVAPVNADQLTAQFVHLNGLDGAAPRIARETATDPMHTGYTIRDFRQAGRAPVRECRVSGLAHAWSGGDDALPFHAAQGPDASEMIWRFFEGQRRAPADADAAGVAAQM